MTDQEVMQMFVEELCLPSLPPKEFENVLDACKALCLVRDDLDYSKLKEIT